ncbi:carboxypeptidase regulatory-like domain-containing protein [Burkholderia contaminans]|nr:carboxypeptidase regulatory-like domain-containing protein [Burkholderia contaminans]MCA7883559.1 carboxypeptidase regulatory-like domain-containing protein [Burkholderia contaminans]MCA8156697.1 carboxypeptidase regulatory-like domain-containing protein [Burkholderia contaminans]VWC93857.1 carboxypeptidase regulatory-like domain protein [Burkholderia contaminans]
MKSSSRMALGVATAAIAVFARSGLAAEQTSLPSLEHSGQVTYLSGGIGSDQSAAIKQEMAKYSLALEFAGHTSSGNEYLADIPVQIVDAHGKTVLSTVTAGPFLLVSMPAGHYAVTATYHGKVLRRSVAIQASSHSHAVFVWTM